VVNFIFNSTANVAHERGKWCGLAWCDGREDVDNPQQGSQLKELMERRRLGQQKAVVHKSNEAKPAGLGGFHYRSLQKIVKLVLRLWVCINFSNTFIPFV
jgi:hypothetical protein